MTQASAPGKLILFGEHAVVYDRPAIAVPLPSLRAAVEIVPLPPSNQLQIRLDSTALGRSYLASEAVDEDPLALAVRLTLEALGEATPPSMHITIESEIPVSAGLGSGAAVTVAIIRGLCRHLGASLSDETISRIAFEVERLHHGTPSGVDNSVVTYEQPVYFRRGKPVERFRIPVPFYLILAHCGESTPTAEAVGRVRRRWEADKQGCEEIFDRIAHIVNLAYEALRRGETQALGALMDQNQAQLALLGVSSAAIEALIAAARSAGAQGAKLSGAGQGGFIITIAPEHERAQVMQALRTAGAEQVLLARIE